MMFFVEMKPAPNKKDIFNVDYIQQCKIKFEQPKHKRNIAQCVNCQSMAHQKLTSQTGMRQMCRWPLDKPMPPKKKDLVMSDVSSMVETILRITRDVWSTQSYKRKHTHLSVWNNMLLPQKSTTV
jgi:hypothetical protein